MADPQRIVILGASFAGVAAARELIRLLSGEGGHTITLIDRHNYMVFTPMLTEVVGGQVDVRHIVSATRRLSRRITVVQGRVDGVDFANRRITYVTGDGEQAIPESTHTIAYDHLVIAVGSVTNYHGIPGIEQHALTIKSVADAAAIRSRAIALLEAADAEEDAGKKSEMLTFVVGGGGFSGVETMAALNDFVRDSARFYRHVDRSRIRTVLVHPDERLLPEISPGLADFATKKLQQHGVEVMLKTPIKAAGDDFVEIGDGRRLSTRLLVWTAGFRPSPLTGVLDVERSKQGAIVVDHTCAVRDHPGVWAIGDCAAVPKPHGEGTYAPTAQNATREGALVARNIVADINGEPRHSFRYHPIGELAIVGRRSGVASIYGIHISGPLAWAMWRAIYFAKMPRMDERLRVGVDWFLDLLFGRQLAELPTSPGAFSHQH
jgi:NADH dehydrogenase